MDKFMGLDADNADIFAGIFQNKLVTKKPTKEEFSALYDQYQEMVDDLKGKNNVHVFSHS